MADCKGSKWLLNVNNIFEAFGQKHIKPMKLNEREANLKYNKIKFILILIFNLIF